MAVTQVCDATAADLACYGEGLGHSIAAQHGVNPVTNAFQRRAMEGCVKKANIFQLSAPCHIALLGHMASAAAYGAAHTVRQQRQVFNGLTQASRSWASSAANCWLLIDVCKTVL